jgi:RNA polymerase sigma factor (sigma-70 family)
MSNAVPTCWTIVRGAAEGRAADREEFARRYGPVVRAYLGSRWAKSPVSAELDDVVQDVFVECFRAGGALDRADAGHSGGFRPFLYGVIRNVALRAEARLAKAADRAPASAVDLGEIVADETTLSRAFDCAWARARVREAAELHLERARKDGREAVRRVEILRLRFAEGLPIREIARRWALDADLLHREQTRARREFKQALIDVVQFQHPSSADDVQRECEEILALLSGEATRSR